MMAGHHYFICSECGYKKEVVITPKKCPRCEKLNEIKKRIKELGE